MGSRITKNISHSTGSKLCNRKFKLNREMYIHENDGYLYNFDTFYITDPETYHRKGYIIVPSGTIVEVKRAYCGYNFPDGGKFFKVTGSVGKFKGVNLNDLTNIDHSTKINDDILPNIKYITEFSITSSFNTDIPIPNFETDKLLVTFDTIKKMISMKNRDGMYKKFIENYTLVVTKKKEFMIRNKKILEIEDKTNIPKLMLDKFIVSDKTDLHLFIQTFYSLLIDTEKVSHYVSKWVLTDDFNKEYYN